MKLISPVVLLAILIALLSRRHACPAASQDRCDREQFPAASLWWRSTWPASLDYVDEARRLIQTAHPDLTAAQVTISATHSHTGPELSGRGGPSTPGVRGGGGGGGPIETPVPPSLW